MVSLGTRRRCARNKLGGEHLDRDLSAEGPIECRVHAAHAAPPKQRIDLVAPDQDVTRLQHAQICPLPTVGSN